VAGDLIQTRLASKTPVRHVHVGAAVVNRYSDLFRGLGEEIFGNWRLIGSAKETCATIPSPKNVWWARDSRGRKIGTATKYRALVFLLQMPTQYGNDPADVERRSA